MPLGLDRSYCTTYIPGMWLCMQSAAAAAAAAAALLLLLLQVLMLAAAVRHRLPDGKIVAGSFKHD